MSVCLFVTNFELLLLFCFSMELSHFLAVISPKRCSSFFLFRPPNAQNLLPKICHPKIQIVSYFLFLYGIEPFFGHQFSMSHSTKRCSLIFDFGLLTPKIWHKIVYKSVCMTDRPEMFRPTRGFPGMADSMEPYKMLWG